MDKKQGQHQKQQQDQQQNNEPNKAQPKINRRGLIKGGLGGLALLGANQINLAAASQPAEKAAARPQSQLNYKRLGRTELMVSDISFGASQLRRGEEALVHHALARGVNYFDTADSYTDGDSEIVIGNALKGQRDKVYLASKTWASSYDTVQQLNTALEASLRRLQTDYIDIYFNHAVNDISRLKHEAWFEFAEAAKKAGKIRYTGISGHAGNLIACCDYALDHDLIDVLLLAYNFGQDPKFYEKFTRSFDFVSNQPDLPRIMSKAHKKDVGVIAMKVLRGAKLNDMRPFEKDGATYAQAAFKWTLANTDVDAAIISMTSEAKIDEYLAASGQTQLSQQDLTLLEQYARLTDLSYCRHACNDCAGACPADVPISDVLRTRMYAMDYGNPEFAKQEYAALDKNAAACLSCDGSPCADACSHSINIAKYCGPTHLMLS